MYKHLYPPKHHQDYNPDHSKEVARAYPFATIISAKEDIPYITHAPLIFHDDILIGHIDANNPQVALLQHNSPVTAIFSGPHTYISPSVYTTKQLPTWNYIIAHARGIVNKITDSDRIKKSIVSMTSFLEGSKQAFTLDFEDPRMDRLVPYIHCFEIEVKEWEGKFKISQDKVPADIENAKQELINNNQKSIADFVNSLFSKHFEV